MIIAAQLRAESLEGGRGREPKVGAALILGRANQDGGRRRLLGAMFDVCMIETLRNLVVLTAGSSFRQMLAWD